jgi:hypothetical protein
VRVEFDVIPNRLERAALERARLVRCAADGSVRSLETLLGLRHS